MISNVPYTKPIAEDTTPNWAAVVEVILGDCSNKIGQKSEMEAV
jgi:hypothetical protein